MCRGVVVNFGAPVPFWLIVASCAALFGVLAIGIAIVKNHPKAKRGDKI